MRKIKQIVITLFLLTSLPYVTLAQGFEVVRGDCTPDLADDGSSLTRGMQHRLIIPSRNWDPNKIYKQMVILVSFRDKDFSMENPHDTYNRMFNEPGYNQRYGPGCVADYFRDQSNGLFNLQFDVYGPVKVDTMACPYNSPTANTRNYGRDQFVAATKKVIEQYPDVDYSQYDWDGNGYIEQVVYVYAGTCGNQGAGSYGYIWPNTSSFSTVYAPGGIRIINYTSSAEMWVNKASCGFGTICHEFTHCLGLPDIYPTSSSAGYSVVDEWDLMDGGNFTNYGWCPPNYTPLEKMLLGWLTPVNLYEPASIRNMKPSAEGGEVYRIRHTDTEWYLLENRQQRGWDLGIPGEGLVVYHVCYDQSVWSGNTVNSSKQRRFELVHADNLDYDAWDVLVKSRNSNYANSGMMNNNHLSTSPYPWSTDTTLFVNDELTDSSVPASKMNYTNPSGSTLLGMSITNIGMSADGLISFDFMGGDLSGITSPPSSHLSPLTSHSVFDLQGRRVTPNRPGVYIIRYKNGNTIKVKH